MLKVDCQRWGQSPEDLRRLALDAEHRRTRERFWALHEITQGTCATRVAGQLGRDSETVMRWVHRYQAQGPQALVYRRTGGRAPLLRRTNSSRSKR
jgi:transposase